MEVINQRWDNWANIEFGAGDDCSLQTESSVTIQKGKITQGPEP